MNQESQRIIMPKEQTSSDTIQDAVTFRSVVVGLLVVLLSEFFITWGITLQASRMNSSFWPMGLFFVYAVLVLINAALAQSNVAWSLRQGELQVVLGMGLLGAFFPFFGLASFLISTIAAPFYLDTPENGWRELLHEHIPPWVALHNEDGAATLFWEGLPPGGSVPWIAWSVPLFWWATLVLAIGWTTLCLMVILRKQWIEYERLDYPLMTVGIHLAADDPNGIANLVRQKGFRVGFLVGFAAIMWNVVAFFYPLFPTLPTTANAAVWFYWLEGAPRLWVKISLFVFGFAYFARVEALFSFWVFFFLTGIEVVIFDRLGVGSSVGQGGLEVVRTQSFGALVMMVLISLYMARQHLRAVFRKAFTGDPKVDDSKEVLSYRTAVFGLGIGLIYTGGWFHLAGMELQYLLIYVVFTLFVYVGLSRIVAEMGLPYANIPETGLNWAPIYILGSRNLQAPSLASQGFLFAFLGNARGFLGPPIAQTLKLTHGLPFRRGRLITALGLATLVGMFFALGHTLSAAYKYGGYNLGNMVRLAGVQTGYRRAVAWIRNPGPPDWDRLFFSGVGMALMAVLTFLRYHFAWWPLPAVGLALMGKAMPGRIVLPVFLAWAYKSIILKVGGVQMYRNGQPFFIGMLIGYAVAVFFSTVIDHFFFFGQGHTMHDM